MTTSSLSAGVQPKSNRANMMFGVLIVAAFLTMAVLLGSGRGIARVLELLRGVDLVAYWVLLMAAMVAAFGLMGRSVNGRWLGCLIDDTFTMSLSRLQVTLWMIVVLSAILMVAVPRIFGAMTPISELDKDDPLLVACLKDKPSGFVPTVENCGGGPLQIAIPEALYGVLLISAASFAGSNLIMSVRGSQPLDSDGEDDTSETETKRDQAQVEYKAKFDRAGAAQAAYQDAEAKFNKAEADVNHPPSGMNLDDLKTKRDDAKLKMEAVFANYKTALSEVEQLQTRLNALEQALKDAKQRQLTALTEARGKLHQNDSPDKSSLNDLFRGNLVNNYLQVDYGKVQMFFVTFVNLLAYSAAIAVMLHSGTAIHHPLGMSLPSYSQGLAGFLALSNGTYLTTKAVAKA